MPNYTVTVTAKTGPAEQMTAVVIADVTAVNFEFAREVCQIFKGSEMSYPYKELDLHGVTTITVSPSAHTITIS